MKKKVFLFLTLFAGTLSATSIQNLTTFVADFRQSVQNNQQSRIVYHGKLYAKKDKNQALWIYTDPIDKKIYYSSGKVVIIEPELEQAIFARLDKVPNILTLLKKAKQTGPHTYVTTFNNTRYTIIFENNQLEEIRYRDELQNKIRIQFSHQKINQPLQDERFVYRIPADYDILEQK